MWANPTSRFHQLWGHQGWVVRRPNALACWDEPAEKGWKPPKDGVEFFEDAWWGKACAKRNWYTGNEGALGKRDGGGPTNPKNKDAHFSKAAPALLGFDETIDHYCNAHGGTGQHALACIQANVNILSLYGDDIPYNICRNVEWQICAAKGTLPGQMKERIPQGTAGVIRFAKAPKTLNPGGGSHRLGACGGYAPQGCQRGYASSDIFHMEVCFYSMMCGNRNELFELEPGDDFKCAMDWTGYAKMRNHILAALGDPGADTRAVAKGGGRARRE